MTEISTAPSAVLSHQSVRFGSYRLFQGVAAISILHAITMVFLPRQAFVAHTLADDAFYYLEIARRFAQTGIPTFDGHHVTTGIHPLWFALLVLVQKVAPDDPWLLARAAAALSSAFAIGTAFALRRLLTPIYGETAACAGACILLVGAGVQRIGLLGMESPLAVLLLLMFLHELFVGERRPVVVGLLAGAAVLGRLDMGPAVAISFAFVIAREGRAYLGSVVRSGLVATALVAPFFAWLYAWTGHLGTTSATMKATAVRMDAELLYGGRVSFGYLGWIVRDIGRTAVALSKLLLASIARGATALATGDLPNEEASKSRILVILLIAAAMIAAAWLASAQSGQDRDSGELRSSPVVAVLAIASFLHILVTATLIPGQADRWYWTLEAATFASIGAWAYSGHLFSARLVRAFVVASILGTLAVVAGTFAGGIRGTLSTHRSFPGAMTQLAFEVRGLIPAGERIGSCNAGTLGWFSRRGVVNLDGLVNDFSFIEARKQGKVREWMVREQIAWFVDCVPRSRQAGYAKALGLRPEEIEEVRTVDGGACEGLVWRLRL